MKETAIVILNYKNHRDTVNCIDSIFKHLNKDSFYIVIVDNASGNKSLDIIYDQLHLKYKIARTEVEIQSNDFQIYLLQNNFNSGYAAGNNVGLKFAYELGCRYLMVLNNDTLFVDDALSRLVRNLEYHNNGICIGPLLLKGNGIDIDYNCAKRRPRYTDFFLMSYFGAPFKTKRWVENYYVLKSKPDLSEPLEVDIISGSCMLFNAARFFEIEFFDESTFLYFEEAIIAEKAARKGYRMILDPSSTVIHLGAQTTTKQTSSLFMLNCEYRSALHYLQKWRDVSYVVAQLACLPMYLFLNLLKLKNYLKKQ